MIFKDLFKNYYDAFLVQYYFFLFIWLDCIWRVV